MVTINASFVYMTEDKFDCDNKLEKFAKREGHEKAKQRMEQTNGCGVHRDRHRYEIDGVRYHECLCGYRNPNIGFYLDLEDKFNKGILPFPGSYLEQPAKVIEIISRINSLRLDKQERDYKEQQLDSNKQRL